MGMVVLSELIGYCDLMYSTCTVCQAGQQCPEQRGFTLLEALLVLLVLGVLLALAVPGMTDLQARYRLQAEAGAFRNSLVLARTEALRRQQRVTLCARASDAPRCDSQGAWQNGWWVFADDNDNAALDAGEAVIETHAPLTSGVHVGAKATVKGYFSYGAEGRSETLNDAFIAGTWRFCRVDSPGGWQVVVNAMGKPRVEAYEAQVCP
jgi:type IV fimbrial biogenesis protein FimT